MIVLKELCRELNMDPRTARIKLRLAVKEGKIKEYSPKQRWQWSEEDKPKVIKLLNGGSKL